MIHWVVEPLSWGAWMPRALVASMLTAVLASTVGTWLYLRRLSMLADAMAHVALPGILVAFLIGGSLAPLPMLAGAMAAGIVTVVLIETLSSVKGVRPDAAIGIVFTTFFAAGVIGLTTFVDDAHIDVQCVLFGDVLAVGDGSLWLLAGLTVAVLAASPFVHRALAFASFDPVSARVAGVPVRLVHYGLAMVASATAVAAFEAVGTVLFLAYVVIPPATAHRLTRGLPSMIGVSALLAAVAAFVGLYFAVWFDWSPAGTQVLVSATIFALASVAGEAFRLAATRRRKTIDGSASA